MSLCTNTSSTSGGQAETLTSVFIREFCCRTSSFTIFMVWKCWFVVSLLTYHWLFCLFQFQSSYHSHRSQWTRYHCKLSKIASCTHKLALETLFSQMTFIFWVQLVLNIPLHCWALMSLLTAATSSWQISGWGDMIAMCYSKVVWLRLHWNVVLGPD